MVSDNLVVQTTDEKPAVLLIAQDQPLVVQISQIFEKNGFNTTVCLPTQLESFKTHSFYKIALIEGYQPLDGSQRQKIAQWLAKRNESKLWLRLFPLLTPTPLGQWQQSQSDLLTEYEQLRRENPQLTVCLGTNILEFELPYFLSDFLKNNKKTALYQFKKPITNWNPLNLATFLEKASQVFISPWHGETYLIQGHSEPTEKVIQQLCKLFKQEFGQMFGVEEIQFQSQNLKMLEPKTFEVSPKYSLNFLLPLLKNLTLQKESQITSNTIPKPTSKTIEKTVKKSEVAPDVVNITTRLTREREKGLKKQQNVTISEAVKPSKKTPPKQTEEQLEQAVDKLFSVNQVSHKTNRINQLAVKTKNIKRKNKKKSTAFIGGMVFVGVGAAVIILSGIFFISNQLVKRALLQNLTQWSQPTETSEVQTKKLSFWTSFLQIQNQAYQTVLTSSWFTGSRLLVEAGSSVDAITNSRSLLEKNLISFYESFIGTQSGDVFEISLEIKKQAELAYKDISLLSASLESMGLADSPQLNSTTREIEKLKSQLVEIQQLTPVVPELFGQQERKNYLVLLQDNQELRPTGGFLQTMALITIDKGVLIDKQVFTSYQIDSMLTGETEVPPEIQQYLGENQLYFRDANWNPDFEESAKTISWMFQRATGKKIDGVVGMNLLVMRDLLEVIGPLDVPEYNEVVTSKNLLERTEFHSELQLMDNSKQTDYLSLLLQKTLDSLSLVPHDKVLPVLGVINHQLNQHQLLVSFAQSGLTSTFESLGWSGKILSPQCPVQFADHNCLVDTMFQVEANVGVNKANYDLKRTVAEEIHLTESGVEHQRTITFKNDAATNAWPQGSYKSYLRFYADPKAVFDSISLNGEVLSEDKVKISQAENKAVFGVLIEVPIEQEVVLELKYHLNETVLDQDNAAYVYFDQKQAGTENYAHEVQIFYPQSRSPKLIAPQADVATDHVSFTDDRSTHSFVGIML